MIINTFQDTLIIKQGNINYNNNETILHLDNWQKNIKF